MALLDAQVLFAVGEAGAEPVERLGELEVGLGVGQLGVERVQLRLGSGCAFAQIWGACAEFIERDELFLVAVDQASQRVPGAGEVPSANASRTATLAAIWTRDTPSALIRGIKTSVDDRALEPT